MIENNRKMLIHADDFGIDEQISNEIIKCLSGGLNSLSAVVNSKDITKDASKINQIKNKPRIGLHLNLVEGKPVGDIKKLSLLIDKQGYFNRSFFSLAISYFLSNEFKKNEYLNQVKYEISLQIEKYSNLFNTKEIYLDSHQHFHCIPFIFDIIVDLSKEHNIKYIRVPFEYLVFNRNIFLKPLNLIKLILLNFLSIRSKRILNENNILFADCFIGILGTGNLTYKLIKKIITKFSRINKNNNSIIEILFHPGGIKNNSYQNENIYPKFSKYYKSKNRDKEKKCILNNNFNF